MVVRILVGDWLEQLRLLLDESVHVCITSPPYFGLRDYGVPGQVGLEATPEAFVAKLVEGFREVRRVLRKDGTLWLNLGDSYNNRRVTRPSSHQGGLGFSNESINTSWREHTANGRTHLSIADGDLKEKDLMGMPWMVAFALRADGWYLRSDIIWSKPNPMPESVVDRPTRAHEYLFLLSKSRTYFYDSDAIREPHAAPERNGKTNTGWDHGVRPGRPSDANWGRTEEGNPNGAHVLEYNPAGRNKRSVWEIATAPFPSAHFATFPPVLVEPCIKAGTSEKGCCPVCGAPIVRVIEQDGRRATHGPSLSSDPSIEAGNGRRRGLGATSAFHSGTVPITITTGWRPSCAHPEASQPVPATVLDCFGGAGTTALVADRLGRDCILIELSPTYAAMAQARLIGDSPMFTEVVA